MVQTSATGDVDLRMPHREQHGGNSGIGEGLLELDRRGRRPYRRLLSSGDKWFFQAIGASPAMFRGTRMRGPYVGSGTLIPMANTSTAPKTTN
jgi:hypothetical protein